MAQYKVPQDVEADDKLIGPFSFRQFVYLLIAGGLVAIGVGLFQIFPILIIIPIPFVLLFLVLALPLKKDQPMETYLAAIVSYYLKPRTRRWTPGQRESTIMITAPKMREDESRARDITGEEATHRLSFLADIVDTGGYSIKGPGMQKVNDDLVMEANSMSDMFETHQFDNLENTIEKDESERHAKVVQEMRDVIRETERMDGEVRLKERDNMSFDEREGGANFDSDVVVKPLARVVNDRERTNTVRRYDENGKKGRQMAVNPSIIELANNPDFSVATISKEANRIKERDEGEVFISLH